jgi:hypothetical protein
MSTVRIGTRGDQSAYCPGEAIEGAIGWELPEAPAAIEVRLFWQTRGKGTEDLSVVEHARWDRPAAQGAESFRFVAPDQPPSFSGRLISVIWAVEVVVLPKGPSAVREVVIGPDAREIVLGEVAAKGSDARGP